MRRLSTPILSLCILGLTGAAYANQSSGDREAHAAERLAQIDTDGSGTISLAEYTAKAQAKFSDTDTNGDGFLSEDERKAAHEAKRAEREAAREARIQSRQDSQTAGSKDGKRPSKMDTDADGFISQAELSADIMANFTRADTDGDGVLSQEEMKAAKKNHRRGGKKGPKPEGSAQ